MPTTSKRRERAARRNFLKSVLGGIAAGTTASLTAGGETLFAQENPGPGEPIRITRLETILVKPRWLFLKVHTDAGIVGLGEPILEGRARTCAEAVAEIEPYLVGQDARRVAHHWQAIYRHAFYRAGSILTNALSGIDMALWDIKGKALVVPIYELLGGPNSNRIRVYAHASSPDNLKQKRQQVFSDFKSGVPKDRPARIVENP